MPATDWKSKVDEASKTFDFATKEYTAELKTNKGPIRLKFFPDLAPESAHPARFLDKPTIGTTTECGRRINLLDLRV